MPAIPDRLPPDGFEVALKAAFTGLRAIPMLALATNNAAPRLVLFDDRVETRVLRRRARRYDEIAEVDAKLAAYLKGVTLSFAGSVFTFTAALPDEAAVRALLRFLARRRLPLTPAAAALAG